MLEYWLWLVMVFGAGNPKIWTVIHVSKNPKRAYYILQDENQRQRFGLTDVQKRAVCSTSLEKVQSVLENCEKKNISVTYFGDEAYPSSLRTIYNPPAVLFYQGDISILEEYPTITVVGTRKPTDYSVRVTNWICSELARAGVVIISGFAVGIDSASHRAALLAKGRTAAVLGCGIDVEYPRDNAGAKKYITRKGLLLSEFLPGTEPFPKNFPSRNRILSGVSRSTLVIQAPEKSGSLITANLALEQGKTVYCVPPADIFDNRYAGVVKYLRDGATPVFSHLDILNEYYSEFAHKLKPSILFGASDTADESVFFGTDENDVKKTKASSSKEKNEEADKKHKLKEEKKDKEENEVASAEAGDRDEKKIIKDFSSLDGLELKIAVLLSQEHQMHIDAIVERLEADENEVASALTELIIEGYVSRSTGQCYGIL